MVPGSFTKGTNHHAHSGSPEYADVTEVARVDLEDLLHPKV